MSTESSSFYSSSQVFFACLSAFPWMLFGVFAIYGFTFSPLFSVFILGYGFLALLLIWKWIKYRNAPYAPRLWKTLSIVLWIIPTFVSICLAISLLIEEFDSKADIFNDVKYRPIDYLPIALLIFIWFGSPLTLSILHFLDVDLRQKTEQGAAANP